MIDENKIKENIYELRAYGDNRLGKYRRNYRRYNYTPFADMENIKNPTVLGYYQGNYEVASEEDTTTTPNINVIKSTIDTLTSKIAQSKVRPFFNCVNGTFKDILTVKQAQMFFDQFFDFQNVNKTVSEAFRDCCIFENGVVHIDDDEKEIRKALPWQVFTRPSEHTYNKLTRVYYEQKDYPVTLLSEKLLDKLTDKIRNSDYVTFGKYYDTFNHVKAYYFKDYDILIKEPFESSKIPFVFLWYNSPIQGNTSESIVDMLNSIQLEIDTLMARINDASQLTPANTYFVPEGSNIKVQQLSNRTAQVIHYRPTPSMTGSPVTVSTPSFISQQYMQTVEQLKQTAYEMVGISQLSAMSQKPTGLNSGIALQSMENIESDRFETQLNQVIRAYVDIAKTCIEVFPQDENILPSENFRRSIKWRDIVKEAKKMSIQFSGADALSKDPSEKLNQLQMLAQAGVIPQSRIAQFIEIPDLQSGYSLTNNAIEAVMTCIEKCIENDDFVIPDFIPFGMLKEEIINTQLSLMSADSNANADDIEKLNQLYATVEQKEQQWQSDAQAEQNAQIAAQQQAQSGAGLVGGENVLTQEAGMQQVPMANPSNLDMSADGAQAGSWNG